MRRPRILHVEDDDADALLIERGLRAAMRRAEPVIMRAATLREAETYLARMPVDLALVDLRLPDAYSLDEAIVRVRYLSDAPIVVVSGADEATLDGGMIRGEIELYLAKFEFADAHYVTKAIGPLLSEMTEADDLRTADTRTRTPTPHPARRPSPRVAGARA